MAEDSAVVHTPAPENEKFYTPQRIPESMQVPSPVKFSFAKGTESSMSREEQLAKWREQRAASRGTKTKKFAQRHSPATQFGKENSPAANRRPQQNRIARKDVSATTTTTTNGTLRTTNSNVSNNAGDVTQRKRKASASSTRSSKEVNATPSTSSMLTSHKHRRVAKTPGSRAPSLQTIALEVLADESSDLHSRLKSQTTSLDEAKLELAYYKYQHSSVTDDLEDARQEITDMKEKLVVMESARAFEAEARKAQDLLEKAHVELREAYEAQSRAETRATNAQSELMDTLKEVGEYRGLVKVMKQQLVELEIERDDSKDLISGAQDAQEELESLKAEIAGEREQVAKRVRGLTEEADCLRMANETLLQHVNQVPPKIRDEMMRLKAEKESVEREFEARRAEWDERSAKTAEQVQLLAQRVAQTSSYMSKAKYLEQENQSLEETVARYRALFQKHGIDTGSRSNSPVEEGEQDDHDDENESA